MTVTRLTSELTYREYTQWCEFSRMQKANESPVDWESMTPQQIKAKLGI